VQATWIAELLVLRVPIVVAAAAGVLPATVAGHGRSLLELAPSRSMLPSEAELSVLVLIEVPLWHPSRLGHHEPVVQPVRVSDIMAVALRVNRDDGVDARASSRTDLIRPALATPELVGGSVAEFWAPRVHHAKGGGREWEDLLAPPHQIGPLGGISPLGRLGRFPAAGPPVGARDPRPFHSSTGELGGRHQELVIRGFDAGLG
jgi:hypothetical protein